ncbi:hypothetical protein [Brevundimonas subvibrioides]|uniref:Uncharacterized protein n=1 Tax=Brevundimonas subvibrioides (strain ATCC 15264 / DSM 4735 / LMG 14903 / NBRC 16000 / CB 81) TaxID=633149 RepID=D9QMB1_BRESC|nr:hypothetical protein [Brevundimonas subvibrioides]ADL02037.1 hypothetical protein Bresu_2730 [Brevundimonas subvibrioides ATCC 15264]
MRMSATAFVAAVFAGVAGAAIGQEAGPAPDQPTAVMTAEDADLTCAAIGEEAAQLSQAMGGAPEGGLIRSVGSVARSGVAMLVPGAGLVMAGADAMTREDRERRAAEARSLAYRWYFLNGLAAGRDCMQSQEAVAPTQPPAPRITTAP